jgi:hypothetical protein
MNIVTLFFKDPFRQHGYGMDPWMWDWRFHKRKRKICGILNIWETKI